LVGDGGDAAEMVFVQVVQLCAVVFLYVCGNGAVGRIDVVDFAGGFRGYFFFVTCGEVLHYKRTIADVCFRHHGKSAVVAVFVM